MSNLVVEDGVIVLNAKDTISITQDLTEMTKYKDCILSLNFETVDEYLYYLEVVAIELNKIGRYGSFYLSAAVSDFYIPKSDVRYTLFILEQNNII